MNGTPYSSSTGRKMPATVAFSLTATTRTCWYCQNLDGKEH
jgi:hypothetical protein